MPQTTPVPPFGHPLPADVAAGMRPEAGLVPAVGDPHARQNPSC